MDTHCRPGAQGSSCPGWVLAIWGGRPFTEYLPRLGPWSRYCAHFTDEKSHSKDPNKKPRVSQRYVCLQSQGVLDFKFEIIIWNNAWFFSRIVSWGTWPAQQDERAVPPWNIPIAPSLFSSCLHSGSKEGVFLSLLLHLLPLTWEVLSKFLPRAQLEDEWIVLPHVWSVPTPSDSFRLCQPLKTLF